MEGVWSPAGLALKRNQCQERANATGNRIGSLRQEEHRSRDSREVRKWLLLGKQALREIALIISFVREASATAYATDGLNLDRRNAAHVE